MAAKNEQKISLKLFVDKEKNRVVFAESDKDFVDILFSFLTMPLGTIVRLLGKQSQPVEIGSLTSLYKDVADLDTNNLRTETCKTMLLHPSNSAETRCRKLKLNIDDTEPTKYFVCADRCCKSNGRKYLSTKKDLKCICGKLMNSETNLEFLSIKLGVDWDAAFVCAKENFIISDDLQVMPTSTGSICALLKNLGISNTNVLDRRIATVGLQEISRILELSLVSRSPMTDMFLREQVFPPSNFDIKHRLHLQNGSEASSSCKKMSVKLILRKSDNMILYAEAGEDFVDFLFSFLTLPLGSVVELLSGNSSLRCIDNLYRSVGDMNVGRYIGSEDIKSMLLHPKLSPQISCKNQPLDVKQVNTMPCIYCLKCESLQLTFMDPKLWIPSICPGGYVKGPTMFMVTDNLLVKPLSSTYCIDILDKLNVPITDLEERVIHVGKEEALCLLKASLISKNALNVGLNSMLKKVKQEV